MGKVIRRLAAGTVPEQTIFDKRFVAECCETFHLHWRNLRLELTPTNWRDMLAAFNEADRKWREHGSPPEHSHLELARFLKQDDAINGTSVGAELCENLYKTAPPEFSRDAEFYEEDEFVHFHYRDLRVEMSVEDFLGFSGVMAEARERLLERPEPLSRLFARLDAHGVLYAVARNWENLPDAVEVGPHSDLDLIVHPAHLAKVEELWHATTTNTQTNPAQRRVPVIGPDGSESFLLVDLRAPGDGYFPEAFAHRALAKRIRNPRGFWTLSPKQHLLALAYHVVHHKGVLTDDYRLKLLAVAAEAGVDLIADGTEFPQLVGLLADHKIAFAQADDPWVGPKLPFARPVETAISSRWLLDHAGRPIHSRIHLLGTARGPVILKQTTGDLAQREGDLLSLVDSPRFPHVLDSERRGVDSLLTLEAIDGLPLTRMRPDDAAAFARGCVEILAELRRAGIVHRDITPHNLLVRDGQPVLIDFGWAVAPGLELPPALEHDLTAAGLGEGGRPPEGGYCDVFAMGVALAPLARDPQVRALVAAMTAPVGQRVTDPAELASILRSDDSPWLTATPAPVATPAPTGSGFTVLVFADEVVASPALLAPLAQPGAGVTQLAVYAPGGNAELVAAEVAPVLEASGLDGIDAVLLAVPRSSENEAVLAKGVDAVLSGRALDGPLAALTRLSLPEAPREPSDEQRTLSVCSIFRDEAPYLREWIEFHRLVGVEHVYLYDNGSVDDGAAVLAPYVAEGFVTVVDWPKAGSAQTLAYTDCAQRFGHESRWIAFIDVDEFFFAPDGRDLRDALAEFEQYGGVHFNYVNYGTSGHETASDEPVIQRFLRRGSHDATVKLPNGLRSPELDRDDLASYHPLNARVSSVIQPARVVRCDHPHFWVYRDGFYAVTENHERHDSAITPTVSVSKLRGNHYWSKSAEESRARLAKGEVNHRTQRPWQDFLRRNAVLNGVADGEILQWLPALRTALGLPPEERAPEELVAESDRRWSERRAASYFIKDGYEIREQPEYFHDTQGADVIWQADTYERALRIARETGATTVVDVGCGSGEKLVPFHPEFKIVGIDYGPNVADARATHPFGEWIEHDLDGTDPLVLPEEVLRGAVVVCGDVIEHLANPERLLEDLRRLGESAAMILLSTPDRDTTRGDEDFGPPKNPCHVREWAIGELEELMASAGLTGTFELVRANDRDPKLRTSLACVRPTAAQSAPAVPTLDLERLRPAAGVAAPTSPQPRRVLVAGVYLADRPNTVRDAIDSLASGTHEVVQRWIALGGESEDEVVRSVTVDVVTERTPKYTLLNRIVAGEDLESYDYVLLCDDDVVLPRQFLDRFLPVQEQLGFALAGPARTPTSFIDHEITGQQPAVLARRTRFVEIGPVVSIARRAFEYLFPFDESNGMGWGYEGVWTHKLECFGLTLGIVDAVPVDHSIRPPVENYSQDEAEANRDAYLAANRHVPIDECMKVLDTVSLDGQLAA